MPTNFIVPIEGVYLRKEAWVIKAPLILVMHGMGSHIDLDQLEKRSNTIDHADGNIGGVLLYDLLLFNTQEVLSTFQF